MYSGWLLTNFSGHVFGAHQRIDRVARKHLEKLAGQQPHFPDIRTILRFEGRGGPDGVKIKSPAKDEPWHYFNPFKEGDNQLIDIIQGHYKNLVKELKGGNKERSAFEAAWLAHAIVDGLTPAHHFPYEESIVELMGGKGLETRTSILRKNFVSGDTLRHSLKSSWKLRGPKGIMTNHGLFELGIASLIAPLRFGEAVPTVKQKSEVRQIGLLEWFRRSAREIAVLGIYERYCQKGWTPKLSYQVRHKLAPTIVQAVTLAWYSALCDAGLAE